MADHCGRASRKARYTSVVSYKLLIKMSELPKSSLQSRLREYLWFLAEYLGHRDVTVSAAGCFNVDYTMFFTILGSIASYMVVVLQFDWLLSPRISRHNAYIFLLQVFFTEYIYIICTWRFNFIHVLVPPVFVRVQSL